MPLGFILLHFFTNLICQSINLNPSTKLGLKEVLIGLKVLALASILNIKIGTDC